MKLRVPPVALLALAVGLGACLGEGERQKRSAGSAVWVDTALSSSELHALETVHLGEVWFEAARLVEAAGRIELRPAEQPSLPARTPITLVLTGRWPGSEGVSELAVELNRLVITHESRGQIPVGLHLSVEAVDREALGEDLRSLRRALGRSAILISTAVDRDELEYEALATLADSVDFVVCDLYGQPPGRRDDTRYWDLLAIEGDLRRLEALEVPYLVGVHTVGSVVWLGEGGSAREVATDPPLMELVSDPRFELEHGFTLEGIDRQVYGLRVLEARSLGEWSLRPGDRLRLTRLASHHLVELRNRQQGWQLERWLGELYRRLPRADETLTPGVDQLVAAFSGEPTGPELEVTIEPLAASGARKALRIVLENRNAEATDLATVDSNYLEVRIADGHFRSVQDGDFYRYDLLKESADGRLFRTLSEPDVLRLYQPLVDGFARVATGPVEVVAAADEPEITVQGRFLLPDSRLLELSWPR